jgi:hypothetical protein
MAVSHRGLRHRHQLTRTRSVTDCPYAATSPSVREYRLWRAVNVGDSQATTRRLAVGFDDETVPP